MLATVLTAAAMLTLRGDVLFSTGTPAQLRVVDVVTGHVRRLTHDRDAYGGATWSPDGRRIAVSVSGPNKKGAIELLDARGRVRRVLSDGAFWDSEPAWSPDGRRLAFVRQPANPGGYHGEQLELMVINADGSGLTQLTHTTSQKHFLSWSPDGSRVVFTASRILHSWVADVDTARGDDRLLVDNAYEATWAPDGTRIAYVQGLPKGPEVVVANPDGSNPHVVAAAHWTRAVEAPTWSPDGRWIAYAFGGVNIAQIWLEAVHPDGTGAHRLTGIRGHSDWAPSWSPDGRGVTFVRHTFRRTPRSAYVAVVQLDGKRLRVFDDTRSVWGESETAPAWRP